MYSKSVFLVSIFFLNFTFLTYLTGPMLYWYIRSVLTDNPRLGRSDLIHIFPMLVFLIASLPYMVTPYSYKVQIATKIAEDSINFGTFNAELIIFPVVVTFLSRPVLVLVYTLWSTGLVIRYLIQKGQSSVLCRQQFMSKWLIVLLALLFILVSCHILALTEFFVREDFNIFYTLNVLQILSSMGLVGLLISPFFFPNILYGLPQVPGGILRFNFKETGTDSSTEKEGKYSLNFESVYLFSIGQKADSCMKELKPYLKTDFNLFKFSVLIDIPVHHLAFYFREEKKQSFSGYRNGFRVDHAKKLIREGNAEELTLEAIGLLSGFSTRNTFFTAFKRAEGISPGVFAAQFSA